MDAVHAKTPGLMCHECTSKVESAVRGLPGVVSVTAGLSRGATSVLFDEKLVAKETIVAAITAAGFDVEAM
ncbi:MAG: copper chaperone [Actinobacteria bacterium]|nr:MAG: copper chaperone [Actinomycetota bacterium]